MTRSARIERLAARLSLVIALALLIASAAGSSSAIAGVANRGVAGASSSNPLAGMRWGAYTGPFYNSVFPYYEQARGHNRQLLAKIAMEPQMFSFGAWFPDREARSVAEDYIANVTGGNRNVLSQMAVFRLDPWEGQACPDGSWNGADQASYRRWIDNFAAGIGSSRVAIVLQPDLPFAMCAPSRVPLELVNFAARTFDALPHATVYVDAGARYWPPFSQVVPMLERAGIRGVRGFALNSSEFDTTSDEIEYGARVAKALAAAGIPGKHFVVNTAENGAGFLNGQVPNAQVCRDHHQARCITLGIPPTTHVADPRWHLSGYDASLADRYVDAYVWAGRPWIVGAGQVDVPLALRLAASSPF